MPSKRIVVTNEMVAVALDAYDKEQDGEGWGGPSDLREPHERNAMAEALRAAFALLPIEEDEDDDGRTICGNCGYEKRFHNADGTAHLMGSEEPCEFRAAVSVPEPRAVSGTSFLGEPCEHVEEGSSARCGTCPSCVAAVSGDGHAAVLARVGRSAFEMDTLGMLARSLEERIMFRWLSAARAILAAARPATHSALNVESCVALRARIRYAEEIGAGEVALTGDDYAILLGALDICSSVPAEAREVNEPRHCAGCHNLHCGGI
jgi:hypothetical protein